MAVFLDTLNTFQSSFNSGNFKIEVNLIFFYYTARIPTFFIILGTIIGDFGSMWTAAAATLKPKESLRCALFGSMDDAARRM